MWSYDVNYLDKDTEEGRKNIVRLLIGDTDVTDPQLQDEEIIFALGSNKDHVYAAGVFAVNAILSKYSRLVNVELDEAIKENYSDLIKNYNEIRNELARKTKFSMGGVRFFATGLTQGDFEAARSDPSRVRPGISQEDWSDNVYADEGYISVTQTTR